MTEQRIFKFFVNGQFWAELYVDEKEYCATTKPVYQYSPLPDIKKALMKRVRFQLAEVYEHYPKNLMQDRSATIQEFAEFRNHMARYFSGFWLVDDELFIEKGQLYWKGEN